MKVFNRPIKLGGHLRKINGVTVRALEYDLEGNIARASGETVPSGAGFAKGCLFIKTDAADGTKALYENQGTTLAASFNVIGDTTAAEIALANGKVFIGNASGVAAEQTLSGDITITNAGVATIADGAVTSAKLAAGAGLAALFTSGVGANESYAKTTDGAQTTLAANGSGEGDRTVLIIVNVDEAFADGDGGQTAFTIGETDSATKFAASTVFADALAGTVFVLAGTLTEEKALLVTGTEATGTGTGGITVTVLALPAES